MSKLPIECAAFLVFIVMAAAQAKSQDDVALQEALMSWAVVLSGLPPAATAPRMQRASHQFFVDHACGGRECKVLGWFPPGDTVYIDERLDPQDDLLAASIVVHEMVHYLQYRSAGPATNCLDAIAFERQAYAVQREFIARYGVYRPVGAAMHHVGCAGEERE